MSTAAKVETGLALEGQFTIPSILDAIETKIKSFKGIETSKFKTTMNLAGFGDLSKETKIDNLVKAFSSVSGRANAYAKSAEDLGVESYPEFVVDGGSVEDWKNDIKLRIAIITHKDELDKLKALQSEARTFLSQEDQKSIFLAKLAGSLTAL